MPHLEHDPDSAFMAMIGRPAFPKQIVLSKQDKIILEKAKAICEQAEALLPPDEQDEENDYAWAAIYLRYVLME